LKTTLLNFKSNTIFAKGSLLSGGSWWSGGPNGAGLSNGAMGTLRRIDGSFGEIKRLVNGNERLFLFLILLLLLLMLVTSWVPLIRLRLN
jgi:hypothetical protein